VDPTLDLKEYKSVCGSAGACESARNELVVEGYPVAKVNTQHYVRRHQRVQTLEK